MCHHLGMQSLSRCLLMAFTLCLLIGCGGTSGPRTVPAGGSVKYKGQPLAGANVAFLGDGKSPPALAITDSSGNFTLTTTNANDGAVPGHYQVTVSKMSASKPAASTDNSMEGAAKAAQNPAEKNEPTSLIPIKYSTAGSSGLAYDVKDTSDSKANQFNIELND